MSANSPSSAGTAPAPELTEERGLLEDILSDKAYTAYENQGENPLWRAIRSFFSDLMERLRNMFPELDVPQGAANVLSYMLIAAVLLLLLWLIIRLSRQLARNRGMRRGLALSDTELRRRPQDLLDEARRSAAAGERRQAVRHAFLALLLYWDALGLIVALAWKTNREYWRELQGLAGVPGTLSTGPPIDREGAAEAFRQAAEFFEAVWYGSADPGEAEVGDYIDRIGITLEKGAPDA